MITEYMARKKVALWIKPKHRINVELIADVYKTITGKRSDIAGWNYVESTDRIAVYQKNGEYTVVFKGTSDPLPADLWDDFLLSLGLESYVTQIQEGNKLIQSLLDSGIDKSKITITGHSLGGYSANSVANTNKIKSVTFNAAAPPTAPVISGAGSEYSTNYHIVGDLISSHTSDENALTIRANKNTNFFNTAWNHTLARFYEDDPTYSFWSAERENSLYNRDSLGVVAPLLYNIPGGSRFDFQPAFSDTVPVNRKEINAAWKGKPLNNYQPPNSERAIPTEEPTLEIPASRNDYNHHIKRRIEADDLARKRANKQYAQYDRTLKSSLNTLKRPSQVPVLWRTRKEYNEAIRGRVVQKPSRFDTISNKNV